MPESYALELQASLVAALKADSDVAALVAARVYDTPPQSATRPFVGIGGIEPRPVRSDCGRAASVTFSIEAHSRSEAGRVEATLCAEAIVAALDEAPLTVDGFTLVNLHWEGQTVARDTDGEGYLAIVAFTAMLDG